MPSAHSIESRLNYLAGTETRPVSHMPKLGVPVAQSATYEKRSVQIHDACMVKEVIA